MPAKNFLKIDQKEKLQKALKENEHPDIRERILMFLLLDDGKTQAGIANFLGCSLRKVAYWCVHGDPENLESLVDERMKGNYQKATEEYVKLLLETIEKELVLIQKHFKSQKSILSMDSANISGRNTPQSPKSFV